MIVCACLCLYRQFVSSPLLHVMSLTELFGKHFRVALNATSGCKMVKAFVVDVSWLVAFDADNDGWKLFFAIVMGTDLTTIGHSGTIGPGTGDSKCAKVIAAQSECKHRTGTIVPGTVVRSHCNNNSTN